MFKGMEIIRGESGNWCVIIYIKGQFKANRKEFDSLVKAFDWARNKAFEGMGAR